MENIQLSSRLEKIIASSNEVEGLLGDEAFQIAGRARANLAPHRKHSDHRITQTKGKIDHFVNLEGPAALSVEEGHFSNSNSEIVYVEGLHVLRDAIGPAI